MLSVFSKKSDTIRTLEPERPPTIYPWSIPAAVAVVLISFVLVQVVVQIALSLIGELLGWNDQGQAWLGSSPLARFIYVLSSGAVSLGFLLWFVRHKKAPFRRVTALRGPKWHDVGRAVAGILCYFVLFVAFLAVVNSIVPIDTTKEQAIGFNHNIQGVSLLLAFASLVILPPIAEEIFFRGFLYGTLRAKGARFGLATLITSLLFGSLHLFGSGDGSLLWIAFLDTFVLSLVLCYLRETTGSIWASMLVHAIKNGFVFANLFILHLV